MVRGTAVVGQPKSRDSYRQILVPPSLREYAIALWKTELKYIWEVGKKDQPCNLSYFIGEIEGVRILIPHSCRYTYVSQMQTLGVDIQTIQSIVGYADVDMTTHYLHVQESIRQSAAEKFSEPFPIC